MGRYCIRQMSMWWQMSMWCTCVCTTYASTSPTHLHTHTPHLHPSLISIHTHRIISSSHHLYHTCVLYQMSLSPHICIQKKIITFSFVKDTTGWRKPMGCLISVDHCPQKSPIISGSFAKNGLQLRASYGSLPPCIYQSASLPDLHTHTPHHLFICITFETCVSWFECIYSRATTHLHALHICISHSSACKHTFHWVTSHIWRSDDTDMNESCTHGRTHMSFICVCMSFICVLWWYTYLIHMWHSYVYHDDTHMNESRIHLHP